MTFRNCYYDVRKGIMHLWETINGERLYDEVPWVPYVYIKDKEGDTKTIDGICVNRQDFNCFYDYYDFCKNESDGVYENKVKPETQFLVERYYKIPEDELEVPDLVIYSLDIEVHSEEGFPHAYKADWPITVISIYDSSNDKIITFGESPYTGDMDNITYIHCKSEEELLRKFFDFMYKNPCDVITGWSIMDFDLPYIINRSNNIFGKNKKMYTLMSPVKTVRTWESKSGNMNIDIAGIHIIDYINAYKWYTSKKPENYKLDYICKLELEKGKVDYSEYNDLTELYRYNWNKYVEYNAIDAKRPADLERKLGYIRLIQALSLLTKCPMKFYQSMTQLVEGAFLTFYRRNGLCAPYFEGGDQETFEAAIVKEPEKGLHQWVIDIDIKSSYPSHVIALNMSIETFVGRILDLDNYSIIRSVRNKEFDKFKMDRGNKTIEFSKDKLETFNKALKRGVIAIAPCGTVFSTGNIGVMANVEKFYFNKRQEIKNKMRKETEGSDKEKELFALQWALKIFLNAIFGITAVPYSRYFNRHISEAITSCGRHTIRQGEKFVNNLLNDPYSYEPMKKFLVENNENKSIDYIKYIDTDSLFVDLGTFFTLYKIDIDNMTSLQRINKILEIAKIILNYVNERTFNETQLIDYNSQVHDFKIMFEQEIVAKNALFVKKKKYALHVVNKDNKPKDDIEITGLEIIRSETPEAIKNRLRDIINMILRQEDDEHIQNKIREYRKELKSVYPEELSANITVNNIGKYIVDRFNYEKGTPWHVKGVANYRRLLHELHLENKYEDITESTKGKVLYVKSNPYGVESITFNRWPKEFDKHLQIDYDKMIDTFFLNKINTLLKPMNKDNLIQSLNNIGIKIFFGV